VNQNSLCALDAVDGRLLSKAITAIDVIEKSPVKFRLARQRNRCGYQYWSLRAVQPRDCKGRQKTIAMYIGNPPETILAMIRAKVRQRWLKQYKSQLIENEDHIKWLKRQRALAKNLTENIAYKCGYYFRGYKLLKKDRL